MSSEHADSEDLSFDELEEIRSLAESPVEQVDVDLTLGECQMARDYAADGLSYEEIAELLPVDQRQLTLHIDGYCDCDAKRGGEW